MGELAKYTYSELERMAQAVVKSGLFGLRSPEQALALMLLCQADGLHPMQAVRIYNIIDGKPAMRADAMLARFQASGGRVEWLHYDDLRVAARFSHPQGGELVVEWTLERAQQAGLLERRNWKQYPRQMLRARVISEGIRAVYPGVITGLYTPEEVLDMAADEPLPATSPQAPTPQPVEALEAPQKQEELPSPPPWVAPDIEEGLEVVEAPTAAPAAKEQAGKPQPPKSQRGDDKEDVRAQMVQVFTRQGLDKEQIGRVCSAIVGREVKSRHDLTEEEARRILEAAREVEMAVDDPKEFWQSYLEGVLKGDIADLPALIEEYLAILLT